MKRTILILVPMLCCPVAGCAQQMPKGVYVVPEADDESQELGRKLEAKIGFHFAV